MLATAATASPLAVEQDDPFELTKDDLKNLYSDIRQELDCGKRFSQLDDMAKYYFDGQGKAFRPVVACLVGRAANVHVQGRSELNGGQKTLALIAEMIHTASLLHDDVIDVSDTRRGKPTTGKVWGQQKSILAGDYVLSKSAEMLANIGCVKSNNYMAQTLVDLVSGEFMQLETKSEFNERFSHYIEKSFKKTASLLAFTCKSSVTVAGAEENVIDDAFQYGKNVGIAFQLIDDILDFVADQSLLGKPAAADLKLGLSTGPVLFACEEFPELDELVNRRFSTPGDVERAFALVQNSQGLERTRNVAQAYCNAAISAIEDWTDSPYKRALINVTDRVLSRNK